MMKRSWQAGAAIALLAASQGAIAKQKVCVFDILGANGDAFNTAKDYALEMQKHGAELELKVYIDERVAVEDYRTGQCDAVMATALRTRAFNPLTASLDSVGASTIVKGGKLDMAASTEVVRRAIRIFTSPQAANLLVQGGHEIGGIVPMGAAYAFVNDRAISNLEAATGKRVAAFDHDKAQAELISRVGARPVAVDVTNFGTMFNNGNVDVIMAPSLAYKPLELHKGMGSKGAVHRFPLTILTYQMVFRPDRFPAGYGQKSREVWLSRFDQIVQLTRRADAEIPAKLWMDPSPADAERYVELMREGRIEMAEKGFYDKRGLKIIKRVRCDVNPSGAECSLPTENW
ncbi:putative solute-binding protein [Aquabacterium fontiphilum]|uniref:putative solute-binding protein n=1 Tax=Aquabacterium fontiphilum TaxID=450365 RepID=UPI00191C2A1E|nr:putative solute-binding protein [Aquabacterium fontiphilum]